MQVLNWGLRWWMKEKLDFSLLGKVDSKQEAHNRKSSSFKDGKNFLSPVD
jgi:hypothetical protein